MAGAEGLEPSARGFGVARSQFLQTSRGVKQSHVKSDKMAVQSHFKGIVTQKLDEYNSQRFLQERVNLLEKC